MNICYLIPSLDKTGPSNVVEDIVSLLSPDNNITVYYFNDSLGDTIELNCKVEKLSFFYFSKIKNFDIVHSHMFKSDLFVFLDKILHKLLLRKTRYISISTLHQIDVINFPFDYNSKFKGYFLSYIWRVLLSCHDSVVCISEQMSNFYKKRIINKNISTIYNGRSFPKSSVNRVDNKENVKKLVTCCLLTKRKGLEQVIKVLPRFGNLKFIILGDGPEKQSLQKLSRELGCSERVVFEGFVKNPQDFLVHADAFILPSRGEGFPLSLLEAASLKLPCIVSNLDMLLDAFEKDELSFFNLDDLDSLQMAIKNCFDNKDSYINNLYSKYLGNFTKEKMAENYMCHYKNLLKM
jgi:L-malate glycosyltransferase